MIHHRLHFFIQQVFTKCLLCTIVYTRLFFHFHLDLYHPLHPWHFIIISPWKVLLLFIHSLCYPSIHFPVTFLSSMPILFSDFLYLHQTPTIPIKATIFIWSISILFSVDICTCSYKTCILLCMWIFNSCKWCYNTELIVFLPFQLRTML